MNNWILIAPMAAFAILAVAGWLAAYAAHQVVRKLARANLQLYAENAGLREEVQERRSEVINLKLQLEDARSTNTRPMQSKARSVRVKKVEDEP